MNRSMSESNILAVGPMNYQWKLMIIVEIGFLYLVNS